MKPQTIENSKHEARKFELVQNQRPRVPGVRYCLDLLHGMINDVSQKITTALIETLVDELNVGMALLSIARETLTKCGV